MTPTEHDFNANDICTKCALKREFTYRNKKCLNLAPTEQDKELESYE